MLEPEDIVQGVLTHAYDPAKRREYYLRTRQLKGRSRFRESSSPAEPRPKQEDGPPVFTPGRSTQSAKQRREEAKARVEALQKRLDRLKEVLAELVEAAKARSGVEPKKSESKSTSSKSTTKESKSKSKDTAPKTAKEKREAADRAEEYREKNGLDKQAETLKADIQEVQQKIAKARADLQSAVDRARKKQPSFQSTTAVKAVNTNQKGDSQNGSRKR